MFIRRRGARSYCYESRRENGRVVQVYLGPADDRLATMIDSLREDERDIKEARREQQANRGGPRDAVETLLDQLARDTRQLAEIVLKTAGYHQHRGEWRTNQRGRPKRPDATP